MNLIQENKQYVDKGIRKEHRNRPSYEDLQTQLEQAKKDKEENEAPSFESFVETEAKTLQQPNYPSQK
ncbi:1826_t:CDS:2 [Entrophospora sp. SA101]|nr:1826_t:CDS:2 [Entrophospora sp. SA101]